MSFDNYELALVAIDRLGDELEELDVSNGYIKNLIEKLHRDVEKQMADAYWEEDEYYDHD